VPRGVVFLGRGCPPPQMTRGSGEHSELPQRGPVWSPSRQCILGIFQHLRSLLVEGKASEALRPWNMLSRNKNFIILPKSWSGHGRTDRTGSAGPDITAANTTTSQSSIYKESGAGFIQPKNWLKLPNYQHQQTLCLLLDAISNNPTSVLTSTPSTFKVYYSQHTI